MRESYFIYSNGEEYVSDNDTYVGYMPSVKGVDALFFRLSEILKFPVYFGSNWDAVNDCLNDFTWFTERKIVLIHKNIPDLPKRDLTIYLEILADSVKSWQNDKGDYGDHKFIVIFLVRDKENVLKALL